MEKFLILPKISSKHFYYIDEENTYIGYASKLKQVGFETGFVYVDCPDLGFTLNVIWGDRDLKFIKDHIEYNSDGVKVYEMYKCITGLHSAKVIIYNT